MLHIKVEERTRELEEQKKLLSTQASELYRQNQLLKQQNEKITKQKGQLIQMSKKVQELTVDKDVYKRQFRENRPAKIIPNYCITYIPATDMTCCLLYTSRCV